MILLSILIRSIESRRENLSYLVTKLINQCGVVSEIKSKRISSCWICSLMFKNCEIIFAIDNKEISSGEKANILLATATGEWISFVDDDNCISNQYVSEILKATHSGADTFAINGTISFDGKSEMKWYLSKDYANVTESQNGVSFYKRTTNHLSPVKRELALRAGFKHISNAEDKSYSDALNKHLKTEFVIVPPLYHYRYSTFNKEYI